MSNQRIRLFEPCKRMIRRLLLLTASLTVIIISAQLKPASAQEPIPTPVFISDDQVNAIAREMYCPVCENIPLDVCSTQACAEWRELIREKLAEGWSENRIGEYFVERFGDRVSSTPPLRGINWLVYLVPPFAFISASVIFFRTVKKTNRRNMLDLHTGTNEADPQDLYVERLEEELKKY